MHEEYMDASSTDMEHMEGLIKEHQEKFDDIKKKLEQKEDELNAKNINFEKEQALVKQKLSFAEKQLEESKTQYDRTVQRYEEKVKIEKEEM